MAATRDLYSQIVEVSEEFMGPDGERFIRKQIEAHLSIRPEDIQSKHISRLIDWVQLMFAMTTEDTKVVDEFIDRLLGLAKPRPTERAAGAK